MAAPENHHVANLSGQVGHDFGTSEPVVLDQHLINQFTQCTGNRQWIHVDVERARNEGPFGSTIAHGLLTLSLIPAVRYELGVYPRDAGNLVNYGFDKVRYLAPVPAGGAIVTRVEITGVEPKGPGRFLGADDPIVLPVNGRIVASRLRDATLETVDCGHLFALTRPEQTARRVERFVAEHPLPA